DRAELAQALRWPTMGLFGEQFPQRMAQISMKGLTQGDRKPAQFSIRRDLGSLQLSGFLRSGETLVSAALMLQECIADEAHQAGKRNLAVVALPTILIEDGL